MLIPDTDAGLALVALLESVAVKYGIDAAVPEPIAANDIESQ